MDDHSEQRLRDDRLVALGRIERRRLLLRLWTTNPRADSCVEFGELDRTASELDPFVTFRHLHLPVLEEREFVSWDRENRQVTRGPRFDELEPLLELLRELQDDLPDRWV